jgi:hypothetical protein
MHAYFKSPWLRGGMTLLLVVLMLVSVVGPAKAWPRTSEVNCTHATAAMQNDQNQPLKWDGYVDFGGTKTPFSGTIKPGEWAKIDQPTPANFVGTATVYIRIIKPGTDQTWDDIKDSAPLSCAPKFSLTLTGDCNGGTASGSADAAATLTVTGTGANGSAVSVSQSVGPGQFNVPLSWSNPGTYGPHRIQLDGSLTANGTTVASKKYDTTVSCGEAKYTVGVEASCTGGKTSGTADTAVTLVVTGTAADGSAVNISQQVGPGAFSVPIQWSAPSGYGSHRVTLDAHLKNGDATVASGSFDQTLTCGNPAYSVTISGDCAGGKAEGAADTAVTLTVNGTGADGNAVAVSQQVGPGAFSVALPWTNPGTYGPHNVTLAASLSDNGKEVAHADFSKALTCGNAVYSVVPTGTCSGGSVSGSADTAVLLSVTGTAADGTPVSVSQSVGPGQFAVAIPWTTPAGFGQHRVTLDAQLKNGDTAVASGAFDQTLTCGNPAFSLTLSGDCSGGIANGKADVESTLTVTGKGADGKDVSVTKQVGPGQFTVAVPWANPGTYGPHAIAISGRLTDTAGATLADATFAKSVTCGNPPEKKYSVGIVGTCDGGTASGSADSRVTLTITGSGPSNQPKNLSVTVGPGTFSVAIPWENPHAYGPYQVTLHGELKDGSTVVASTDFSKSLTCGNPPTAAYSLALSGTCDGGTASGSADNALTLTVTGTGPKNQAVSVTRTVGPGTFSVPLAWSNPGTFGPFTVDLSGTLKTADTTVATAAWAKQVSCGTPPTTGHAAAAAIQEPTIGTFSVNDKSLPMVLRTDFDTPFDFSVAAIYQPYGMIGLHKDLPNGTELLGNELKDLKEGAIIKLETDTAVLYYRVTGSQSFIQNGDGFLQMMQWRNDPTDIIAFSCYGKWDGHHYNQYWAVQAHLVLLVSKTGNAPK